MGILGAFLIGLAVVWEISRWIFELAGNAAGELSRDPRSPHGVQALRDEFEKRLPDTVYEVFEAAVAHHRRKEYRRALKEYEKLREIPARDGTFDLYEASKVFRYNWRMLRKDMGFT